MKKSVLAIVSLMVFVNCSFSQTLFTYGKNVVTKDEFLRAFNKNPTIVKDHNKALKEYLDLYINFKLKVQAAYDAGLDKDATQQYELQNFKKQVADNIINDEANVKALVRQAFDRSQKEIHLQQVFVEVPQNNDTADAYKKIQLAYKQLKDGKDFGIVAQEFSTDEATKQSKGDIGFITVFTLPYEIENTIYNLKEKTFSIPYRSKSGYHIFRNVAERTSSGSRRVAQILIALPPNATPEDRSTAAGKADSLYKLLTNGANFSNLAAANSSDVSSSNNGGELPEFTVGTYDKKFEDAAFSLKNKGEISKPFQTGFGFHILKLLEAKPAATDINDPFIFATIQDKVIKDNRLEVSKKELIQKKLALIKYKPSVIKEKDIFIFTDSALRNPGLRSLNGLNQNAVLFSFAGQNIKASDWIYFLKAGGYNTSTNNDFAAIYMEFVRIKADEYYRNNLAVYNSDFAKQLKEFKEANLLFGIMEKNVWGKANTDTLNLLKYYNEHKAKYIWPASSDAIIITCNNESLVKEMQMKLKDNVNGWRQLAASNGTDMSADSGRYELSQLPVVDRTNFTPALITAPVKNQNDGTYTFNYIVKVYDQPSQRNFEDARGMVISDYQQVLEDKWITELKRKYPVKINEAVLKSIK